MSTFARFPPRLQEAIVSRLGWTALRPVQELAGTAILDGKNAVVLAPTAGGKTEASIFSVLAQMMVQPPESVGAIYIAPIKALLNNQEERLGTYTEMVGMRRFVWHGDARPSARRAFAEEPAELLMTTPESLEVMLLSTWVPVARLFESLRFVVIDEVHAMAGVDRGAHLMSVLERLARFARDDFQRIGLSATVGNPETILKWLTGSSRRDGVVVDPPKSPARRALSVRLCESVSGVAAEAGAMAHGKKSLFFCQSRALTESVAQRLRGQGTDVFVHHSSVSFEERQAAEERFHGGRDACIVCTSTLELGIDVGDLDLVLQANAPSTVSSFMQRMGRTGRRGGQVANTTFFCEESEAALQAIALIKLALDGWVEPVRIQDRCWPVLVHQILAMTLQFGGVSVETLWHQLSCVPDFSGIGREEFEALLAHMHTEDYLFLAENRFSMGEKAERVFGRRNFMELYAVFSSPQLYRVLTASKREIGSLEQAFVDQLVEEMSSFLLGGRAWVVDSINHKERIVQVCKAPSGSKPKWGAFMPQILSFELCQKVKHILTSEEAYPYVDRRTSDELAELRIDLGSLLKNPWHSLRIDEEGAHWWTFAGGRINHTIKHALGCLADWKVSADNFQLRIQKQGDSGTSVEEAIRSLGGSEFWDDPKTQRDLMANLPNYRLSKFQRVLPDHLAAEMIGAFLFDVEATRRWCAQTPTPSSPT